MEVIVDGNGVGAEGIACGKFAVNAHVDVGEMTRIAPPSVPRPRATDGGGTSNPVRRDPRVRRPDVRDALSSNGRRPVADHG